VAIAHQPATTADPFSARPRPEQPASTRPAPVHSAHRVMLVEEPPRVWTFAKIVGLVAVTAATTALVAAVVAGSLLFAMMTMG
jgi:hypothetical protein